MPIDPNDILAVAILLSKHNTEAADRSAVSRAYYCVYHHGIRVAEEKLPPVDPEKPSKGCHQQLNDRLREGKKYKLRKKLNYPEYCHKKTTKNQIFNNFLHFFFRIDQVRNDKIKGED